MRMTLREILKERHDNFLGYDMREYYIHGNIPFFIVNDLDPEKINIGKVINIINKKIPKELFYGVDGIYVAHLPEFDEREINAIFKDGAIYVTNQQDNDLDMLDDIVHELAHSTESQFMDEIYGDDKIEDEFLARRKKLYQILKHEGYVVDIKDFLNINYDHDFDFYLYDEVGYNALSGFVQNLFLSPYAVTSLREYYASAFTDYFLYNRDPIKRLCPTAYLKIKELIKLKEEK